MVCGCAFASALAPRTLTFEDRVAAQQAIEQVYWAHRVWPKENRTPKPPLSAVLSDGAIRARVEDYLQKSNALETFWQRPVTTEQLQAELDRIVANTHDDQVLGELFATLKNDPLVIAETIARPTLVGRLIRNWYESDARKESFDSWWNRQRGGLAVSASSTAGSYVLPRRIASTCVKDSWLPTFVDVPEGRSNHTAVWTGSEMIVWGGENGQDLDTGWRYNPSTDSWEAMPADPNMPSVRQHHTAVWTGTEMIVWGGTYYDYVAQSFKVLNTGGRYDPATNAWVKTSIGANVPVGRSDHTAVWTGSEMIIWGGGQPGQDFQNTGGRYTPATDSWAMTSNGATVPSARMFHTAVWTGDEMIVWGGTGPGSARYLKTGGRYNPTTDTWLPTSVGTNVPLERRWHTAVWTGEEMVVWGGYKRPDRPGPEDLNSGGRYKPSTDTWESTSTDANVPSPRHFHPAVWTGSEMIVWGGTNGDNTGGRYSPISDSWVASSTGANVPAGREHPTAVWTGAEMIVWGGGPNTGGRYNPTTDSWVATAAQSIVPEPRSGHTAIWTGAEMIVWGGDSPSPPYSLNTGGRYEPATDNWTPTSTGTNVPRGRDGHTAIWDGTEMIVWGGFYYDYDNSTSNWANSGGRYNPSSDSWAQTSTGSNVPVGRTKHTAIWTGTEMVIWGGAREPSPVGLITGGRYDPATDSWVPTPTSNGVIPASRYVHTAVWTGTEMIVWGGNVSNASGILLNTGNRYNPSTDSWSATSTTTSTGGVVVARSGHTAVWTGAEMIVWGGWGGAGVDSGDPGARYSPSTDSWSVSSASAGVPPTRGLHEAVWTGSKMIVWGGANIDGLGTNTGSRYDPSTEGWVPTSIGANVPTERGSFTAVWTDTEMIVWGGHFSRPLRTGGRYSLCQRFFRDADGDGHGDPATTTTTYDDSVPAGYVTDSSDCNDASAAVYPGAPELCDQLDNNCNGTTDEDALGVDTDRDGVRNACDNCRFAFNPDQLDTDGDGLGNVCDRIHPVPRPRTDNAYATPPRARPGRQCHSKVPQ
jgi:N-acetylneuraminic acid mutarotase